MTTVSVALERFRGHPRRTARNPFALHSSFAPPSRSEEIEEAWPQGVNRQARELWSAASEARLLADVDYGQWGLVVLSPTGSAARTNMERSARPADVEKGDVVIGEFLGDQDLLVLARTGQVLVALPLDHRGEWYVVGRDLADFLDRYWRADGEKFWESQM